MKRVEFADDELGDVGEKDKRKRVGGPLRRCVGAFFCFLRIASGERRREERRLGGLRLRRREERRRGGAFGNVRRVERALERRDFSWGALGRRGFVFFAGRRGGFSENVFFCRLRREIVAICLAVGYNEAQRAAFGVERRSLRPILFVF